MNTARLLHHRRIQCNHIGHIPQRPFFIPTGKINFGYLHATIRSTRKTEQSARPAKECEELLITLMVAWTCFSVSLANYISDGEQFHHKCNYKWITLILKIRIFIFSTYRAVIHSLVAPPLANWDQKRLKLIFFFLVGTLRQEEEENTYEYLKKL